MSARLWSASLGVPLLLAGIAAAGAAAPEPEGTALERYRAQNALEREWLQRDRAQMGDLDADGVVGLSDLRLLLRRVGERGDLVDGDLTGDGLIDRSDVGAMLSNYGKDIDSAEVLRAMDESGLFDDVIGDGSGDDPLPPGDHLEAVSDYPGDPPQDHQESLSDSHPNHVPAFSNGWPNDHSDAASGNWPPNHPAGVSGGWPDGDQPWPPGHFSRSSQGWPGNHTHETSPLWPPYHNPSYSVTQNPGEYDHNEWVSNSWDHDHNPAISGSWPPNHFQHWSLDWGDHDTQTSQSWPHNHLKPVSDSWDDNDHQASVSRTWPPHYVHPDWEDPGVIIIEPGPPVDIGEH